MKYNFPTPGAYVAWLFPVTETRGWAPSLPRVVVAGFVNVICCYVILRVPIAIVSRFRKKKDPAAPGGRA